VERAVEIELEIRGAQLRAVPSPLGAAEEGDVAAALQGLFQVGLVEPDCGNGVAAVTEEAPSDGADAAASPAA
jgi:hypothetical protein